MRNRGYFAKEHLALVDETLRQLEQENLLWSQKVSPTQAESEERRCRLYDISQPVTKAMQRLENGGGCEQP